MEHLSHKLVVGTNHHTAIQTGAMPKNIGKLLSGKKILLNQTATAAVLVPACAQPRCAETSLHTSPHKTKHFLPSRDSSMSSAEGKVRALCLLF